MSNSETLELYNNVGTQEKRAINRLLRVMASGKVDRAELGKVCRSVSRLASDSVDAPKRKSGYIVYYQQEFEAQKKAMPSASLGDIARVIGKQWRELLPSEKDKLNKLAKEAV
jgi:hypothetical protein